MLGDATDIRVEIQGTAADLRLAARSAVREIRDVGQEARRQTLLARAGETQNLRYADSYDEIRVKGLGAAQSIRNFGTSWRAVGWSALLGNIGPITAGLQDLAAAGIAAGSAVAPLGGLIATLPYGFGVAGQAAGVLAFAFHGVEDALKGNKDALAALDPEQRKLVELLKHDLAPEVQKLQGIVQDGFLPGFDKGLEDALTLMPTVQKVLGDTAKEMGDLAEKTGRLLGRDGVQRDIRNFGETNVTLLSDLGDGGLHFADGLRHVTAAAEPLTLHLGDLFEEGGRLFDQWATAKRRSGDLADFFDLTSTRVDQSLSIVGDFAGVLGHLFTGSQPLADSMMSGLVDNMDELSRITGSPQGQRALKQFFADARQPLGEVVQLAGDLVVDLGRLGVASQDELGQLARVLRTDALPAISDLALTISQDVMPDVVDLAGDLANLAHEVEPGLKPIVGMVGDIASGLGDVVDLTADVTADLPGVAKLIPTLAVGGGVLLSWRKLKDLMGGLPVLGRGGRGGMGPVAPQVAGGLVGRGSPADPLYVVVMNGGLPVGPGGKPAIVPPATGGGKPGVAGPPEQRTPGGVILPAGVNAPRYPQPKTTRLGRAFNGKLVPVLGGTPYMVMAYVALDDAAAIANAPDKKKVVEDKIQQRTDLFSKITNPAGFGNEVGAKLGQSLWGGKVDVKAAQDMAKAMSEASKWMRDLKPTALTGYREELKKLQALGDSEGLRKLAAKMREVARETDNVGRRHALRDLAGDARHLADVTQALGPLNDQLEKLRRGGDSKGMAQVADQARALGAMFPEISTEMQQFAGQVDRSLQGQVAPDFKRMQQVAGLSMDEIRKVTRQTTRDIKQRLGADTAAGKDALAHNMQLAVGAIQTSMKYGQISTQKGLEEIRRLLTQELALYGITGKQAKRYMSGQDTVGAGGPIGAGNEGHKGIKYNARGGLHDLGRPGTPGRDRIPLMLNRQPVIAAEGESIAVLTRHQRAGLDHLAAGAGYGGLRDYISRNDRPNFMARGGIVEAARGADMGRTGWSMLSGDTDFLTQLGNALERMAEATHTPIHVTSGRRTLAEQQTLYEQKGAWSPTNPGAAPPDPNAPHVRGIAGDINPGRERFGAIAEKYGLVFPVSNEPWHVEIAGGRSMPAGGPFGISAKAAAAAVRPWKNIKAPETDAGGVVGQIVQAALDRAAAAANQRGQEAAGATGGAGGGVPGTTYTGPLDRVFPPGVRLSEQQVRGLLDAGGMSFMPMYIPIRESGLQPGIIGDDAAKGYGHTFGYGLLQVTTGVNGPAFEQVVQSLGGWQQMLNPVKNIRAAKWLSAHASSPLAPWSATAAVGMLIDAVFAAGGTLLPAAGGLDMDGPRARAADAGDVIIGLGDPKAPDTAAKPKPKAKHPKETEAARKRSKAKKIPATDGPGRPDLSKARPRPTADAKAHRRRLPAWLRSMIREQGAVADLPFLPEDLDAVYVAGIAKVDSQIANLERQFGLTDEQATVQLYDSARFRDLTAWLTAHPEDLAGARDPQDFMRRFGNGLEVVNQQGMNVQGKWTAGIGQHVAELQQLLEWHTGSVDGTGEGGQLGRYASYLEAVTQRGPFYLGMARSTVESNIKQLRAAFEMRRDDYEHEKAKLRALDRKSITSEEAVGQREAQIDMLRDYKRRIADAAIGHRLSDEGKHNRAWADQKIADLQQEISDLQTEGQGPLLKGEPVKPTGKHATPEAVKDYREQHADWERRQHRFERMYARTIRERDRDAQVMRAITGGLKWDTSDTGRPAGFWTDRITQIADVAQDLSDRSQDLQTSQIPAERQTVADLLKELADWQGTSIAPPPLDITADDSADTLAGLLREQRDEALRNLAVSNAQFSVLSGFGPLVGQRLLGQFLHGGTVPETGPYLLHRDEQVVTDPQGPFGSQLQPAQPAAAGPVSVELHFADNTASLVRLVDARVDGRAARVVAEQQGRRTRLIAAAPGGR